MEKEAKETKESAADIRKKMKCRNCGKAGHISTDRKKEKSGKPQNGNFKNKGEKVGWIFSASEVSDAVNNDEDEGFVVASQEVVFCATFESDVDEDYPVDAEGEDFEVMEESKQMPELIAPVSPMPVPVQPSRFAASYPLPQKTSPEGTWREYNMDYFDLINRTFRSWLVYQSRNYTQNQLVDINVLRISLCSPD